MAAAPAHLQAQRDEREARGLVGSLATTIYNAAWPTATYDGIQFLGVERAYEGYDVPILLYGTSGWTGGDLWLELVVELRHGSLHDIRVGRYNGLWPPFGTLQLAGEFVMALAADQRRNLLVGTWRDENSVFTYTADGRWWCEWDSGSRDSGTWTLEGNTLTWYFSGGEANRYNVEYVYDNEHRTRSIGDGAVWTARRVR